MARLPESQPEKSSHPCLKKSRVIQFDTNRKTGARFARPLLNCLVSSSSSAIPAEGDLSLRKLFISVLILAALGLFLVFPRHPIKAKPAAKAVSSRRPKLIVMVVIDQFPYEYLARFKPYFVEGGFNLLLGGADFVDCRYEDAITATCPGHAALSTGAYPNGSGIIGNQWYDRALHKTVNCVEDNSTRLLGGTPAPGRSPARLIGDTFSDELRLASNFKSRVISISLKDRGAIIPGGHTSNAAYWYDPSTGHFVSSTYYMPELPAWVERFNSRNPAGAYCDRSWRALPETPGANGKILEQSGLARNEPCPNPRFLRWLNNTPYMSEIQLNFAKQAIQEEHLGQGPETDLLAISLSENDHIGHEFGPYSPEVADMTLRTDRDLAGFFKELDRTVGLDNVWITLSADHGVAPSPKFIEEHHLGPGRADMASIMAAIDKALLGDLGPGDWIEASGEFQLYLNRSELKKQGASLGRAEFIAAEAAASLPQVEAAFTRSQILTGNIPNTPLARKVANSFNSQRSGDIYLILAPYAVPIQTRTGTTHGSPWNYDSQVPLIFWGTAFKPGMYSNPVQPIDLPATLAAAMGIGQPSGAQGRPLAEAIR
jgi:predicted AlkP superfamily pyrophosphatase or phosphodiesterase